MAKVLARSWGGNSATLAAPEPDVARGESIQQIARSEIVPSPLQPRKHFAPEELTELVASIQERGIIQPLIVRKVDGKYELIAGERRWRASAEAGLETLPVIIREAGNREVLELALIENLQRADLSPIEEAEAYARLMNDFSQTQEQVATQVGKSRVAVANAVRLLGLPEQIRTWVNSGDLSVGHAKVLLGLKNADEQMLVAERIRKEKPHRARDGAADRVDGGELKPAGQAAKGRKVPRADHSPHRLGKAAAAAFGHAGARDRAGRERQDRGSLFHCART